MSFSDLRFLSNMSARFTRSLLLCCAFLALSISVAFSQTPAPSSSSSDQKAASPFQVGEVLTYEAKFNRTLLPPMTVGDLVFSVVESPQTTDGVYLIKSEAQSRGVARLLGKDITQKLESRVDGDKFRILRSVKSEIYRRRRAIRAFA